MENHYGITRYELRIDDGYISLRFYSNQPRFVKGYSCTEAHPFKNGKSLPSLRKDGERKAKMFGVPFVDLTK